MTKYDNIIPMKKYNGAGLTQEQIDKDKIEIEFRVKELVKEYFAKQDNKNFWVERRAYETAEREFMLKDVQDIKANCSSKTKDCCAVQVTANDAKNAANYAMGWLLIGVLPLIATLFGIVFFFAQKLGIIQML